MYALVNIEVRSGGTADIYDEDDNLLALGVAFNQFPRETKPEVPAGDLAKLKQAGFDAAEIVQMRQAGVL